MVLLQVASRLMHYNFLFFNFIAFAFVVFLPPLAFSQSKYSNDPSVLRDPTGYKLRSGDQISLYVRGETETNIDASVDGDGLIKPVYLNELKISGLSTKEVENLLIKEYQIQLILQYFALE